MKSLKNLMLLAFMGIVFFSCKDNNKKDHNDDAVNMDPTEMNKMDSVDENRTNDKRNDANNMENGPTVADVVESSDEHSTLLKAMKEAGIIVKLDGPDEYTVFAPTNSAFSELPKGTINDWMKPENSEKLEGVLSYHIIPGRVDSAKLKDLIKESKDHKYVLVTGNDGKLTATMNDAGNVILTDGMGKQATVVSLDMNASNGVVHSINRVLMRK